jgi:hypothetical protein
MRRRLIAHLVLGAQLLSATSWAYDLGVSKEIAVPPSNTSEFIYRNDTDEALIPVYLMGAVAKPGLYHIPSNTDLVALLTLAGGPSPGAQTDKILVKGQGASGVSAKREIRFDLESAVHGNGSTSIGLTSNDLVYVTPGKAPVTADVLTYLGIATGIMGVIASSILLSQTLSK